MIESLQGGVHQTVKVMETSQQQAAESVAQASKARDALEEIAHVVDTITQMSAQIATAAEQQSSVAEDINRNVVEITHLADSTAKDSSENYAASELMSREVDKLVALLGQFQTSNAHVTELQRAMAAHLGWKAKIRGFLDGKGSLDERVAFDHTRCGFGKWYAEVGMKEFSDVPEMAQVAAPHSALHELIRRIAQFKQSGDLAAAEREYERVGPLSEQIVEIMKKIQQRIAAR
jgi:methyl-accepting chemotaxis protein